MTVMEEVSDLRLKRTQARGKATKLLKDLFECDTADQDELALRIDLLESPGS